MKKTILISFMILTAGLCFSQTYSGYLTQKDFKAHRYHGFRACYDSIIVDLQLDSNQCYYLGNGAIFQGNSYNNNEIVVKCPQEPLTRYYWDWPAFWLEYSPDPQDIYKAYKNNVNGYISVETDPTIKRQETYSGTTNGSGVYTVTFGTAYATAPNIQANLIGNSTNQYLRITSVSTTGFTINAYSFTTNTILGIVTLGSATTNLSGANVDVLVTEK